MRDIPDNVLIALALTLLAGVVTTVAYSAFQYETRVRQSYYDCIKVAIQNKVDSAICSRDRR